MTSNFSNQKIGVDALVDKLPALGVSGTPSNDVLSVQGITGGIPFLGSAFSSNRSDTFSTTSNGTIVSGQTFRSFSIQVGQVGSVTSWTIVLEGSLDGVNFSTILTATNVIGINVMVSSGTSITPCLFFRSRCVAIVLGGGTSLSATVLGTS